MSDPYDLQLLDAYTANSVPGCGPAREYNEQEMEWFRAWMGSYATERQDITEDEPLEPMPFRVPPRPVRGYETPRWMRLTSAGLSLGLLAGVCALVAAQVVRYLPEPLVRPLCGVGLFCALLLGGLAWLCAVETRGARAEYRDGR